MKVFVFIFTFLFLTPLVLGSCSNQMEEWVNEFYGAVVDCPVNLEHKQKLRSMLTDDMIWVSADNVTFTGADIFVLYTCSYPGLMLVRAERITQVCTTIDSKRHILSGNYLIYNVTGDPLDPNRQIGPLLTFFQELDDFTLTPHMKVTKIQSYASPRQWYNVMGYCVDNIPT